jgi:hypothetical protein
VKFAAFVFAALFFSTPSLAAFNSFQVNGAGGGGGGASCPIGVHADGCTAGQTESVSGLSVPGPPTTNAYTIQNTWTSLARSGQTWATTNGCATGYANCHPAWNVPGVDYPVGVRSTALPLKDASVPANWSSVPGCSYSANRVTCSGQSSYTIRGFNFGSTAAGCVALSLDSRAYTLQDNYFANTGACATSVFTDPPVIGGGGGGANGPIDVSYNLMDGFGDSGGNNQMYAIGTNAGGTLTMMYNAVMRTRTEPGYINAGSIRMLFNYYDGVDYPLSDANDHDHFISITPNAIGGTTDSVYLGYNMMVTQVNTLAGTSFIYIQGSNPDPAIATYNHSYVYNSHFIANTVHSGGYQWTAAIGLCWRAACLDNHQTNNFVDTTGAVVNCSAAAENTGTTAPFTIPLAQNIGNVFMRADGTHDGASWNNYFQTDFTGNGYFNSGGASSGNPC